MIDLKTVAKYKFYFLPVLVLLIILITGSIFLKPKVVSLIEIQKKNSLERKRLSRLTEKVVALEGLDVNELTVKSDSLLRALPAEKDIPNFLASIKIISQQAGVSLLSLGVDPGALGTASSETKSLPFVSFNLLVQGEKDKIKDFIQKIETVIPLMRVTNLSLSDKEDNIVDGNIVLNAYFQPLPEDIGSIEQPILAITKEEDDTYQTLASLTPVATESSLPEVPSGRENPFSL